MKSFAILALLGLTLAEAVPEKTLIRLNTSAYGDDNADESEEASEDESDDSDDELVQLGGPCVYLDET